MLKNVFSFISLVRTSALALSLTLGVWQSALATGFFINQQTVKGLGRVGAGDAAAADGLGTIFANPAGLTEIWGNSEGRTQTSIGGHLIIPRAKLRNTGSSAASLGTGGVFLPYAGSDEANPTNPSPIPNLYWAQSLVPGRAAIGVGVNFPFGLATKFHSDWYGRYDAIEAALRTINLSAVGAYKFDSGLSIGGGLDLQYANSHLVVAIPDPLTLGGPTVATDGRAETNGQNWKAGFNLGALYPLSDQTRVGVHYRSGMNHSIDGSTTVTGLTGMLTAFNGKVGARADLNLPAIGSIGVRHKVSENLHLLGQVDWFDWSRFKEVRIRFANSSPDEVRLANYRDAYGVAVGAEYRLSGEVTMRSGVRFDQTPTVDGFRDTTVPDSDRLWLGIGATYQKSKTSSVDFAFNHVFFRPTKIAVTRPFFPGTPLATVVNVNGRARSVVNTISINGNWAF